MTLFLKKSSSLSWETFQREPATRQFDWSFATMPMSHQRVARQNGLRLPVDFRPPSPSTSIVHCLSGLISTFYCSRIFNALMISLVRVTRRVKVLSFLFIRSRFHFSLYLFSHFDRSTYSLSVTYSYLALDFRHHLIQTVLPNSPTLTLFILIIK